MAKPDGTNRNFSISKHPRALLAAALVALGPGGATLRAQQGQAPDLTRIRAAAEAGDPEALNALANAYANGQGVPLNMPEAIRLYQLAASRGFAAANFNLGMVYELGRGVAADQAAAFRYYLKAAEQGFAPAQFNVGNMYANGAGVKQDDFEAALWFRQAADKAIPEAQYNLARAYEMGKGVGKDDVAAQRWYRTAATQGYARARYNLALMLEEGRGSPADPAAAVELYRAAAMQNFAPAQNNLGILIAEERGTTKNLVEAYAWLALAAENGAKAAGRDIVGQQLTPAQLAEATTLMAKLRPQLGMKEAGSPAASVASTPAIATTPAVAAPAVTAPPPAASPAPDVSAINARLAAAQSEVERLRAENSRLSTTAQSLAHDKSTLEQRLAAAASAANAAKANDSKAGDAAREKLQQQVAILQSALNEARDLSVRLTTENTQLKKAAAPAPRPSSEPAAGALRTQVEQLTHEAEALRADKTRLQQQADDLAAQLKTARESTAPATAETSNAAAPASTLNTPIPQLAAADPRIAKLIADNTRYNDEVKRSTIELSSLYRQLRAAQEKAGIPVSGGERTAEDPRIADLNRQLADLRTANDRLTEENRKLAATPAPDPRAAASKELAAAREDLAQARAENERLKKASVSPAELTAAQQRATRAEQALADTNRERETLAADKAALQKQLGEHPAPTQVGATPEQLADLRNQLGQALSDLEAAQKSNEALRGRVASAEQLTADRTKQLTTELEDVRRTLNAAEAEKTRGATAESAQVADLRRALTAAQQSDAANHDLAARTQAELEQTRASLEKRNSDLAADVQRLTAAGANAKQDAAQLTDLRRALTAAQESDATNRDLAAKARSELEQTKGTLEKRSADLKAEVQRLTTANTAAKQDGAQVAQLRSAASAAEQRAAAAEEAARTATQRADRLTAELADAKQAATSANSTRDALATAEKTAVDLRAERDRIAGQLSDLQRLAQAQGAADRKAVADARSQLDAAVTERDKAVAAQQASAVDRVALEKLNAQLDGAGRTINDLTTKNDGLQKDLEVARQSAAAALAAQAAAAKAAPTEAMKLELRTLQDQVRTLESQNEEDRKNAARELATVAAQLQTSRETNRSLNDANRALLTAKGSDDSVVKAEIDTLTAKLKAAQADAVKARADYEALQAKAADAATTSDRNVANVTELTGLNEKLTNDKAALEKQVAQLRQSDEQTRAELADIKTRMTNGDRVAREQQASFNELTATNDKLQTQVKDQETQLAALRAENTRLGASGEAVAAVRTELADVKAKLADAQKTGEQQVASVNELTGANERLTNQVKDLQGQLTSVRADNSRLAQNDEARVEAEQRAANLSAAANQLATAQRDLASARAEIARLTDASSALERDRNNRIAQLQQENAAISARLRQAQGTLDQIASAARVLNGGTAPVLPTAPVATTPPPAGNVAGSPLGAPTPTSAAPAQPRIHVVAEGESLTRISARYYGTAARWQEIYDANRDVLRNESTLHPGQRLKIP